MHSNLYVWACGCLETKGKTVFLGEEKGKQNGEIKAPFPYFNFSVLRHINNQNLMDSDCQEKLRKREGG